MRTFILAVPVLALTTNPALAGQLRFEEALARAEAQAPSLRAKALEADARRSALPAAGQLPDPKLGLGIDNFPVSGPPAGSFVEDSMTMARVVAGAIGGENVGQTVEGLARYPINVRYPRELRDSPDALRALPVLTPSGQQITLGSVAQIAISDGPPMLKTENGRPSTWVYVDVRGRDLASVVDDLQTAVAREVKLSSGVSLAYSGQFEYLARAIDRLKIVVPATLAIIFLLLYLIFRRLDEAVLIMGTLPFALTGGFWILYLLGYHQSVATGVGFIALAGVAAEFGVVMLIYLRDALEARGEQPSREDIAEAVREGALLRVRPKAMTVAVIIAGLLPILVGSGAGSEVMSRIAAPMVGGMLTAPLLSMFVIPAAYLLLRQRSVQPSIPMKHHERTL